MSHTSEEACWICGAPTTNRCSSCGKAGIDIYFCSAEHQKLVWPVHKLVCGPDKANPFVWPDLTKEEVKDLEGHLDSPFYDRERKETTTCRKLLSRFPAYVHPIELSNSIFTCSKGVTKTNLATRVSLQHQLTVFRMVQYTRLIAIPDLDLPAASLALISAQTHLATIPFKLDPMQLHIPPPAWFSETHHRCLIFLYLSWHARTAKADLSQLGYPFAQVVRVLTSGMGVTDSLKTEKLLEDLRYYSTNGCGGSS